MKSVNAQILTDEDNPSSFSCILDDHSKIEEEVVPLEENITEIDDILNNSCVNNSGISSNGKDFLNGSEKMHEDNPSPNSITEPMECGSSIASEKITTKCTSDDVIMSESTEVSFVKSIFITFFLNNFFFKMNLVLFCGQYAS